MSTIIPLFTTLLQKLNLDPPKDLIDYTNQYYQQYKYKGKQRSSRIGWQSSPHTIQQLQPVYNYINQHIYTTPLHHGNAWINVNHTGAYNVTHIHPNSDYTFVYYLSDNNSNIVIQNPLWYQQYNHIYSLDKQYKQQHNIQQDYTIQPNKGDILIFPSYLPHYVEPNIQSSSRLSISWGSDSSTVPRITPHQS